MKIEEYINILKKEYKAKVIDFDKEIRQYFSRPDMYDHCGKKFNVFLVSERAITSDKFVTLIVKGSAVDPLGKFDWGTKAIIVFAEYNDDNEVFNHTMISSFFPKDVEKERKMYRTFGCYKIK